MLNASLFEKYASLKPTRTRRSERSDFLDYFTEKINADRRGTQFKELTKQRMAFILSIYTTEQLYHLRIRCDKAKNFSKTFWWFVKCLPDNNK